MPTKSLVDETNSDLADALVEASKVCSKPISALILEAAERLAIVGAYAPGFSIASLRQVGMANPSQWEFDLDDGNTGFIRYTRGKLTVFIDDVLSAYDEPGLSDSEHITLEQIQDRLRGQFVFPPNRPPLLRRVV